MLMAPDTRIVLASQSPARRRLLEGAGLSFDVVASKVDEEAVRLALTAADDAVAAIDVAEILARAKAEDVARREDADFVIAADQVLEFGDDVLAKPADMDQARRQLMQLKGARHQLHAAVVIAQGSEVTWAHTSTVDVHMRDYSPAFVGKYLSAAGDEALASVGCYQLEGPGVQLIERYQGDYFAVLGLPLMPLLDELRRLGALET